MRRHTVLFAVLLAGCAGRPSVLAIIPPAPVAPPVVEAPPAPTPTNAGLSAAATLWHLRAGLNVAALACRGPAAASIAARYNAMLAREAQALRAAAATVAAEQGAGHDDAMTRLYNFWGQARGRAALCAAADAALDDPALADHATAQLAALDRGFAPPRLAVDPRIFGGPAIQVAAR